MMKELSIGQKARRLILAATGEEYGDGYVVTDIGVGYAEPGYHDNETVWVLGNWNGTTLEGPKSNTMPLRLFDALERIGVECEWYDVWEQCDNCHRLVRTQPDSYSWKPSYVWNGYGYTCHECALENIGAYLDDYIDNADRALTWCEGTDITPLGFVKWEPGDEHDYESGWHPGQDDDPATIMAGIHQAHPDAEVVFMLDYNGQFDCGFSAWVRGIDQ